MAKKKITKAQVFRSVQAGEQMANAIIEFCEMMYNIETKKRVLKAIERQIKSYLKDLEKRKKND